MAAPEKARAHRRRRAKKENPYPDLTLERSYLVELPIEIVSNILKYVNPVDLLALTRTNHYFHKTLVHPQQQHIWRTARKQFPQANIPDPVRFSEIAVAALLFGTGPCSFCNGGYDTWVASFMCRVRKCNNSKCTEAYNKLWMTPPAQHAELINEIVPFEELRKDASYSHFYYFHSTVRQSKRVDVEAVLQDIGAGMGKSELEIKYKTTSEQTTQYNNFLSSLRSVTTELEKITSRLDSQIRSFVKVKLPDSEWEGAQYLNSITYINERRRLLRSYQEFTEAAWNACLPRSATHNPSKPNQTVGERILEEMESMKAAAQRRKTEANLRKTRGMVNDHWQLLKNQSGMAGSTGPIIPRVNEFKALPVVSTLLKPNAGGSDVKELNKKDSTLAKLVDTSVSGWEKSTSAQFRKLLKVPITKGKAPALEPGVISPLNRITALFECTKCKSVGIGLAQEGTLTLRSAVNHRCAGSSKKFKWSSDLFQPDAVAIQIAQQALALSGRTEEKTKREDMDDLGACFLCKVCTCTIHLTYGNLIGHMKRHNLKELQGSFEYQQTPSELNPSVSSSNGMVEARRRGAKKGYLSVPTSQDFFVCRHCNKSLLWNGLVSHVKEKHHFSDIRDEDFYPKPKPPAPEPAKMDESE
ncbi:hypothetical protein BDV93DRAFT_518034 [Ceratobasidium sp. AG-I]|nr:hypothetical protein BDV93DRAFT_518034 [Ceratobasidium sp. AG-I]